MGEILPDSGPLFPGAGALAGLRISGPLAGRPMASWATVRTLSSISLARTASNSGFTGPRSRRPSNAAQRTGPRVSASSGSSAAAPPRSRKARQVAK